MNSLDSSKESNIPATSREPVDLKIRSNSDLFTCDMDFQTMLKGDNPFGDHNGLSEEYGDLEEESDNNAREINHQSTKKDSGALSASGARRPVPVGSEDDAFEIEDLISSSDEEGHARGTKHTARSATKPNKDVLPPHSTIESSTNGTKDKNEKSNNCVESSAPPVGTTSEEQPETSAGDESSKPKPKPKQDGKEKKSKSNGKQGGKTKSKKAKNKDGAGEGSDTPKPKRKRKKKTEDGKNDDGKEGKKNKKRKKKNTGGGEDDDKQDAKKRKKTFERRNIRKIIDDKKLDDETISAQKQEQERIQRLQKIQEQMLAQQAAMKKQRDEEDRQREEEEKKHLENLKQSELQALLEAEESSSPPIMFRSGAFDTCEEIIGAIPAPDRKESIGLLNTMLSDNFDNSCKSPDVVEILSSSEDEAPVDKKDDDDDSDNEVVILKSDPEEEEDDEDAENSGSHVNDLLNLPDDQNRVLVNVGHPDDEDDLFLAPQITKSVKPHQIGGIRFLYDNLVESIQQYKTSSGFGCILAHSMGLGKTIQMISFIDIFMRYTGAKTVLVIVPINTLQNWVAEFNMWLPTKDTIEKKRKAWRKEKEEAKRQREAEKNPPPVPEPEAFKQPLPQPDAYRHPFPHPDAYKQPYPQSDPYRQPFPQSDPYRQPFPQPDAYRHPFPPLDPYQQPYPHPDIYQQPYPAPDAYKQPYPPPDAYKQPYPPPYPPPYPHSDNYNNLHAQPPQMPCAFNPPSTTGVNNMKSELEKNGDGTDSLMDFLTSLNDADNPPPTLKTETTEKTPAKQPEATEKSESTEKPENTEITEKTESTEMTEDTGKTETTEKTEKKEEEEEMEEDEADPFENIVTRQFPVHIVNDNLKTNDARGKVVEEWHTKGGVLLMGYEMYRLLTSRRVLNTKPRRSKKKSNDPVVIDIDEEDRKAELMSSLQEALIRPGPDLIVCDEGHRIKNSHASISQALKNIRTRRRVVLTGYPLQNNLVEYWCMVDFVRPNYLGSKTEFTNMFERPITNGQCVDSNSQDMRLMKFRAHVLHSLLEGFVQRRGHGVLKLALPEKEEYVLLVRMSPIQRQLYKEFMGIIEDGFSEVTNNNPLKAFAVCCKIWNHPDILNKFVMEHRNPMADDDLDIALDDEASRGDAPAGSGKKSKPKKKAPSKDLGESVAAIDKKESQISYDWAVPLMETYKHGLLENGGKMLILVSIIQESLQVGDKILVFSQSLFTLNLIEEFLSKKKVPNGGSEEYWAKNKNYFRLDGSTSSFEREKLINAFNQPDNDKVHIFLLSTRAGCLGINLVGANRVVVFDASWNPCHDCQAVCRVYRYGQKKKCYVYRLVTDNTMEKKIYDRQINKQGMSDRVVDELNPQHMLTRKQVDVLLQYNDVDLPEIDPEKSNVCSSDAVLQSVITKYHAWITKDPFTHESLLLDKKEEKLTKTEKRLAKQGYEMEKKLNISYSRPSYASFYPTTGNNRHMEQPMPRNQPRPVKILYPPSLSSRPVASVRPMMSTPVPMRPTGDAANPRATLRPGVTIQQVQTTTDITIPGTNTSTNAGAAKIPAGENVLVIKTPKGVYIRTTNGKIFAVRTAAGLGTPSSQLTTTTQSDSAPVSTQVVTMPSASTTTTVNSTMSMATSTITTASVASPHTPATDSISSLTAMDTAPESSAVVSDKEDNVENEVDQEIDRLEKDTDQADSGKQTDAEQTASSPSEVNSPHPKIESPRRDPVSPATPLHIGSPTETSSKYPKSESLLHKMMKTHLHADEDSNPSSSISSEPHSSKGKLESCEMNSHKTNSPDVAVHAANTGDSMTSPIPENDGKQSAGSGYHPLGSLQNLAAGGPAPLGSAPPSSHYMPSGVNPYSMPGQFSWGMGAMGMPPMWMPPMPPGSNDYSEQGAWWPGTMPNHMNTAVSKDSHQASQQDLLDAEIQRANKHHMKPDTLGGQLSANGHDPMSSLGMSQDLSTAAKYGNEGWTSSQGHQSRGHGMMGGHMQFPSYPTYGMNSHQPYMPHHTSHINSGATSGGSMSYNYPPMMPSGRSVGHMPYPGMMPSFGMNLPSSSPHSHRTFESDHDSAQE